MVPLSETPELISPATLALLRVNPRLALPLQLQLVKQLRSMILNRQLQRGQKLPSTRALSEQLEVSRNTVLGAFDQLSAEGYLEGARGSGTFVAARLPEDFLKIRQVQPALPRPAQALAQPTASAVKPFRPCVPSVAEFPLETWERLRRRVMRRRGMRLLHYSSPAGDESLREQIAAYLRDFRGVHCDAAQIVVTAGAQQAFGLIARVLARPGDRIVVEDPGYIDARDAFVEAGLTLVPQRVDAEGLTLPVARDQGIRLIYTTPSRQFPLGVTMTLDRRMAWLNYAAQQGLWLIEDDYDSEFRYEGRPLPSLQGLLPKSRVVYVGTFSKALYPSLRLGYVVAPSDHFDAFWQAKETLDVHSPSIDQAVLAEFLREGHFARHLRRMRTVYAERAAVFAEATAEAWGGLIEIGRPPAGLNAVGWLKTGLEDDFKTLATTAGYQTLPLSRYALQASSRAGLFFGFAAYPPGLMRKAIRELAAVWEPLRR